MSDDKIKSVPLLGQDALLGRVEKVKRNSAAIIEMIGVEASWRRAKFMALKKSGFDDKQALELCKGPVL